MIATLEKKAWRLSAARFKANAHLCTPIFVKTGSMLVRDGLLNARVEQPPYAAVHQALVDQSLKPDVSPLNPAQEQAVLRQWQEISI